MSCFDEMMVHTCNIVRNTPARDSFGVVRPAWATVYSSIACLIQESAGSVRPAPTGAYLSYDAIGFFDFSVDIRPQGNVTQNQPDAIIWNGKTMLAVAVIDDNGMQDHWTVYLKRLPGLSTLPGSGSGVQV